MVDKGLFVCKEVRPDIQLTIEFMSNRVKYTDKYDYYNLIRLIQYLKVTQYIHMILRSDNKKMIEYYIGTDHELKNFRRGHT